MSLITEEQRAELENKSTEDLIKIVKETKPNRKDKTVEQLIKTSRRALSEDYFWVLADLEKSIDAKALELGKGRRTILGYRYFLLALELIKPYNKRLYTADYLIEIEQRFPHINLITEAANQHTEIGEEFTIGQIADKLGIPKLGLKHAVRRYGVEYGVYNKLEVLLSLETRRGNLKRRKKDRLKHYTRVNELSPIKISYLVKELFTKDDLIEADQRFPNRNSLREWINQHAKEGEKFSGAEMADRMGIPRVSPVIATKKYKTDYKAYQRLTSMLRAEVDKGNLEKRMEYGTSVFTIAGPLPLIPERKKSEASYNHTFDNNKVVRLLEYLKLITGISDEIEIEGENIGTGEEIPIKVDRNDYSRIDEFCEKYDVYGINVTLKDGTKIDFVYDDKGGWSPFRIIDTEGLIYMGKHAKRQFSAMKIYARNIIE